MRTALINNFKTAVLLGALTGIIVGVAAMFGQQFVLPALVLAGLLNFGSWFFSDRVAIAAMRGREVDAASGGELYRMVDELRRRAGLPMPRVYVCPQQAPNAFATGRSPRHAAVAVTQGALAILNHDELRGVMAHELAHVKNRDTLISTVAATAAGVLAMLAQFAFYLGAMGGGRESPLGPLGAVLAVIVGAVGAALIRAAISRSREFVADAEGARIAGSPHGLVNALRKLDALSGRVPMQQPNPAQNSLFIVEPLTGGRALTSLFATHPPTEARIAALLGG